MSEPKHSPEAWAEIADAILMPTTNWHDLAICWNDVDVTPAELIGRIDDARRDEVARVNKEPADAR